MTDPGRLDGAVDLLIAPRVFPIRNILMCIIILYFFFCFRKLGYDRTRMKVTAYSRNDAHIG